MKWFKHYADSLDDTWIQELMDKFGHFGYVGWFGIIGLICRENKNNLTGKATFSPAFLKRKLRSSPAKLRQFFDYCSTKGKLLLNCSENEWSFELPKILEIKDNYIKDLQGACNKPSKYKEKEEEVEKDKETPLPPLVKKWILPGTVNADVWNEFEKHRKEIKKPLTDLSRTKNANILAKYNFFEQKKIVDKSIASRWPGLFPDKDKKQQSAVAGMEGLMEFVKDESIK